MSIFKPALLFYIFTFCFLSRINAQFIILFQPEVSISTFNLPISLSLIHDEIAFNQRNSLIQLDFPSPRFLIHSYSRSGLTFISEISNIKYSTNGYSLQMGRDYVLSGPKRLNSTLFGEYSPSLDQFAFHFNRYASVEIEFRLIRLDNRKSELGTFNRWLYYQRFSFLLGQSITIGIKDAVLATGIQRGVDLNYVNPGVIFQLEQLHGHTGPQETAMTNNDNQLIGIDFEYSVDSTFRVYSDFLIDEFQIDVADRAHFQDVFGLVFGLEKVFDSWKVQIEYYLASPWLYTNGGNFTNVEIQGYPLGLKAPQMHGLTFSCQREMSNKSFEIMINSYQNGDQTILSELNSHDNKIEIFDFNKRCSAEIDMFMRFDDTKYLKYLRCSYNLLGEDGLFILVGLNLFDYIQKE